LPEFLVKIYADEFKITTMFDWQVECLNHHSEQILKGCKKLNLSQILLENLIYSAPTSAGKTLVSELLMLHNLLNHPSKKAIIVLPYVSLITEKESRLMKLITPMGLKMASIHSHKSRFYNFFNMNRMFNK
jgi:replicative superfamily II helicase